MTSEQTQMNDVDYQHLLRNSYEKQRQQLQDVISDPLFFLHINYFQYLFR